MPSTQRAAAAANATTPVKTAQSSRHEQGCPGKNLARPREGNRPPISSWPGSTRPSTPWDSREKDVDARIKSAQDDFNSLPGGPTQVILARKFFPDSPAARGDGIGGSSGLHYKFRR